jgi:aspartate aminotransferase
MVTGYAFPNALLQHALPDLDTLSIDIPSLQGRRDRMAAALRQAGYALQIPQGTFYLMVRSPLEDDAAFVELLGEENILCLPGSTFEMPGYFRISLTANDAMVERALPGFARAFARAKEIRANGRR